MKELKKILIYLVPYWKKASLNVIFNILSTIFGLFAIGAAIPFLGIIFNNQEIVPKPEEFEMSAEVIMNYFKHFLSDIREEYGAEYSLLFVGLTMILMSIFKNVFRYIAMYNLAPIRNGVPRDIRNKVFSKVLVLPLSYYSEEKKGDIMSRMTSDVQEIEWSLISSIEMLVRDPLTILIYLVALFYMSFKLTLFVLILLPISGFLIGRLGKTLKKTSFKGQRRIGILLSIMEETLGGLRIIKAFNAQEVVKKRFQSVNSFYTFLMNKMFRRRYLANPLSELLGTTVMVIIMWYGGSLVISDGAEMKSQELIAYLMMFYMVIAPSKSFSTAYYNIQKGLASAERINSVLEAEIKITEKKDAKEIKEFKDKIEYKEVCFKYQKDYVLKNINLTIEKGKTVALVGESGAGKSTIADLLPRLFDVNEGGIFIDGINIKDYKINDLRNLMGIVNQDPILFNDTFYNNISFGNYNIPLDDVIKAAKVANAHDFINTGKNGYYTNIGDRGVKLSGGQRQRVSIARAVLKNPPILILDEATSSLDTKSEKLVQEALFNLMKNRTSLVIAHRLSTVRDADIICVLDEGEIVEMGKHSELMQNNGHYKKLHNAQMFQ